MSWVRVRVRVGVRVAMWVSVLCIGWEDGECTAVGERERGEG